MARVRAGLLIASVPYLGCLLSRLSLIAVVAYLDGRLKATIHYQHISHLMDLNKNENKGTLVTDKFEIVCVR